MKKCDNVQIMMPLIDAHSHFSVMKDGIGIGIDRLWPVNSDITKYCSLAKNNNINQALLMPCPSPQMVYFDKTIIPFSWEEQDDKVRYFRRVISHEGKTIELKVEANPYKEINFLLWNYIQTNRFDGVELHFIPLLNLVFDEPSYLLELIALKPRAFKVHGISSGLDDFTKINKKLLTILSAHNIPLIIHTDYFGKPNLLLEKIYNQNSPLNWLELMELYGIRAMLTHGARLCKEAIEIINSSDNYIVGMAPDLLLKSEPSRLCQTDMGNYMEQIFLLFKHDKIVFDVDFPWNVADRFSYEVDEEFLFRFFKKLEMTDYDLNQKMQILANNVSAFFAL